MHLYSFILEDDLISIVAPKGARAQDQATGAAYSCNTPLNIEWYF